MSSPHKRDPRRPKRPRAHFSRPNRPDKIAARLRHAEWVRRRLHGERMVDIAASAGVAVSTVCAAITAYMAEVGQADAIELRAMQNERLDLAFRTIVPVMTDDTGDALVRMRAADSFLRAHKRFSEVNGCDAPARAPVDKDGNTVGTIDGQDPLAMLLSRFDRLAARRTASEAGDGVDAGTGGADAI